LRDVPLLTAREREQLLVEWNPAPPSDPAGADRLARATLHEIFEQQAALTPDAVALTCDGESLSYRELDDRASHLAAHLHTLGVGPEVIVGLCIERSLNLVVGLLAILKAGGAYLPLDLAYPPERIAFILEDARAPIVLTQRSLLEKLPSLAAQCVCIDALPASSGKSTEMETPRADGLAYVIYTSGSTGKPKGCCVTHRNVVRLFQNTAAWFRFGADDVWTMFHSVAFDFSVWEIWGALLYGGRVIIVPHRISRSPEQFHELLARERVTILNQTPSAFRQLIAADAGAAPLAALRVVIFGGEALELQSLKPWFDRYGDARPQLINMYGITETTVHVTYRPLRAGDLGSGSVIGIPIPDLRIHILDPALRPVPIGVPGEMFVGGEGVARGYLNRPELTAGRFIESPFSQGMRLYRTGDLARWLPGRDIEYLGRIDHQVKIRGFRIELGEIESVLVQHPHVREAVVVARAGAHGEQRLLACIVPDGVNPAAGDLRAHLKSKLPDYMVPAAFVCIERFPLTNNGKIDLRALPDPEPERPELASAFTAPRTPAEQVLAGIWREVLRLDRVGVHDNFFDLGGDSILSIQIVSRARQAGLTFTPRHLFDHQTIAELAAIAGPPAQSPDAPREIEAPADIAGVNIESAYALSPTQEGLLFHCIYDAKPALYWTQYCCKLSGALDASLFRRAWREVATRHPILRTAFAWEDREKPLQVVSREVELPWVEEDWRALPADECEPRLADYLQRDQARGCELARAPLMRFALFRCGAESHQFVWSHHHLLLDGWSVHLLLNEAFAIYDSLAAGCAPDLAPCRPYRDFIGWMQSRDIGDAEVFWRGLLKGYTAPTALIADRAGAPAGGHGERRIVFSSEATAALQSAARQHRLTLNTFLQGAWALLLSRYSGEDDVVFGATLSGRPPELAGVEEMAGLFINTLPLRAVIADAEPVVTWLRKIQDQQIEARRFEHTPLVQAQGWSDVPRGLPLFESILVFENYPVDEALRGPQRRLTVGDVRFIEQTNYPLTVIASAAPDLTLQISYDAHRFSDATVARMLGHLRALLEGMAAAPQRALGEVPMLTAAEREQLLEVRGLSGEPAASDDRVTVHGLFEQQAARTPDAIAVAFENERLTYRELDARAELFAGHLRAHGVGPDVLVGLCVERSIDMVVGIIAILKAGGAYLPLDLAYPQERIAFILEDARAPVLVTQRRLLERLPSHAARCVCIDEIPPAPAVAHDGHAGTASVDNLAYVIYTSGSTGKPKGCCVTHRNVVRLFQQTDAWFGFGASDVWTLFHSCAFDFSVWEIWGALLYGGRLVVVPYLTSRSPEAFHELLAREQVTVLNQTPSAFRQLIAADENSPRSLFLRYVIFGGEALEMQSLKPWFDRRGDVKPRLVNMYGITETTVHVTYRPLSAADVASGSVIGVPIPDLRIHILDRRMEPVPIGVPGEMYVGGGGLARGYLRRPELTAQRFIASPFHAGERLYKTGDVARRLDSGDIEYLGRADDQVKIRGFRIELGEIESVLCQHPAVREAVVIARGQRLVAYVVSAAPPAIDELRSFVKTQLPEYMTPAAFVVLAALPLTNNGKVDRRALPEPDAQRPELSAQYVAPRTPAEEALAGIWSQVLRIARIGVHDNFFALGGDSILSIQIIARARQAGLALTPKHLFENQTVAELAAVAPHSLPNQAEQGIVRGFAPLTPIQHWFFERELAEMHHWNQAFVFKIGEPLDADALARAALAVERHHDALRLRFRRHAAGWQQHFAAPAESITIPRVSRADVAAIQASLNLADGPLWRLALIDADRLLIAVHHLAVDGVSWRILVEDLETAYMQLRAGEAVRLPPKTTSFKQWSERLTAYAQSGGANDELDHWLAAGGPGLPPEFSGENTEASARTIAISLDPAETRALLQDVPAVYRTQINDVLLTAFSQAFGGSVNLDLEGHGREEIIDGIDVSRTVGWFTTIFPVRLETGGAGPGEALKSVKEQLRAVPRRGIGYGVLRYLLPGNPLAAQPHADIVFNYLGQFDQVVAGSRHFRFSADSPGPQHSAKALRRHALEVNCLIVDGCLELRWTYSENLHRAETIGRFATNYLGALRALIAHCQSPDSGGRTPSDFPLVQLDQATVDRLAGADRNVEDILPLAPMQLLFYTLGPAASHVADQWQCRLRGALDAQAFQRAWREVTCRHSILRTVFRADGLEEPLQVVLRDVEPTWTVCDWRDFPASDQARKLADFLRADRERGFDLAEPPLMRFALLRLGDDVHHFIWTLPDLQIDGWSWPLVFREVSALYGASVRKTDLHLERSRPYRDYVAWLRRQTFAEAETFWRRNLRGITEPTPLPIAAVAGGHFSERSRSLSREETSALTAFAREAQLTVGTLLQAAWALILARQSGRGDVLYGAAFSGRPTDLAGAESIAGPFVNNLPVRSRIDADEAVPAFLKKLHGEIFRVSQHQFSPLLQVQSWSEMPWRHRLFDSLLVFQNYLVDDAARRLGNDVEICDFAGPLHTNYALTLLAVPGPELQLTLVFRESQIDPALVERLLGDVRTALTSMMSTPAPCVSEVLARLSPQVAMAKAEPAMARDFTAPATATERAIAAVWAEAFGRERVGVNDNFFDLGGHSLLMLQVHARLRAVLKSDLPIVSMFQFPTISTLARHLDQPEAARPAMQRVHDRAQQQRDAVARKRLLMKK
jgi:amino acid adenylation domain-containing protein/non-ribosomal peptide synthase protein (TIGR01720 family)